MNIKHFGEMPVETADSGLSHQDIDDLFGNHVMTSAETLNFMAIKQAFSEMAHKNLVPQGPMQTRAIRKLFEAKNEATCGFIVHLQQVKRERAVHHGYIGEFSIDDE